MYDGEFLSPDNHTPHWCVVPPSVSESLLQVQPNSRDLPLPDFASRTQMTGLDIEKDQILEMACLVTDSGLNILAEVSSGSSWLSLMVS